MISLDDILNDVKAYNPGAQTDLIRRAYEFSAKAHEGQKRKSGEPYLVHPLEVAKILTQLKMDVDSLVAAILHDTIEDTKTTKKDIEKNFGKEIAEIVDGVTKISKLQFSNQQDRQAETYRKMILAMSQDIRVILVKLADRLNNMRTLQYMPESKQVSIAQETLDIFSPLAGRMGIQWVKEELENLSLKFLKPEVYKTIEARLQRLSQNRAAYMKTVTDILEKHLRSSIPDIRISGRVKQVYSIYFKMLRSQVTLDEIHDLIAFRVLAPTVEACYEALGIIHSLWRPVQGRFKDYIAMAKPNNYQSLHTTVICLDGERVEFQIRTVQMHEIAEKGIAAHWKYKEGGRLDTKDEAKFRWLRQLVDWQKELKDSLEFVDTVKLDLFADEIYVYTPKGELKSLSRGSTPVDFAYAVHSLVGNRCGGAKVNGRIVPLNHKLESGDTVEILTNEHHTPSKDWLDFVVTPRAKTHIRHVIRHEQRGKSVALGKNLFESDCRKAGVSPSKILKSEEFSTYLVDQKLAELEDFYSALAYGKVRSNDFLKPVEAGKDASRQDSLISRIFKKIGVRNKNAILVDSEDDVLVTFGRCCTPIKDDPIIGFVSRGRGVVIHRTDCPKVLELESERRVTVDWNSKADSERMACVKIVTEDRKGALADITRIISEKDVNILRVLVKANTKGIAVISMDLGVKHLDELRQVIKAVETVKGILSVERESR